MFLAELSGSVHVGLAAGGSAIGIGLVGAKATEAIGRNPGALGTILMVAILGMAMSESILFLALFLLPH
jgi:F-type H+-transporting ATPase subunit c